MNILNLILSISWVVIWTLILVGFLIIGNKITNNLLERINQLEKDSKKEK